MLRRFLFAVLLLRKFPLFCQYWFNTKPKTSCFVCNWIRKFSLSVKFEDLSLNPVLAEIFFAAFLSLKSSSSLKAFNVFTPGIIPSLFIITHLLPDPVFQLQILAHTPIWTRLFPQNCVFGIEDQSLPFKLSFWFCVKPSKYRFSKSSLLSLENIGSSSFKKTAGSLFAPLYVLVPLAWSF